MDIPAEFVEVAHRTAFSAARRLGRLDDLDEFQSLARYVLTVEYARHPDLADADLALIAQIVQRRLIDAYRSDDGRYRPKAHSRRLRHPGIARQDTTDGPEDLTLDLPDPVDVAAAVVDRMLALPAPDLVAVALEAFDDDERPRFEIVLAGLADGTPLAEIGDRLGVTESRASQLSAEAVRRILGHDYARARLAAAYSAA